MKKENLSKILMKIMKKAMKPIMLNIKLKDQINQILIYILYPHLEFLKKLIKIKILTMFYWEKEPLILFYLMVLNIKKLTICIFTKKGMTI